MDRGRSSPGRWVDSPGSRRRSPSRSLSRSPRRRSLSRSVSHSRSPPPYRSGPPPGRRYSPSRRRYSRSRSRSPPGALKQSPLPGQRQKEAQQTKGREHKLRQRIQELEEQLQQEGLAKAGLQARADVAQRKLVEVAERSRARGNTLLQLVSACQAVVAAKQQLAAAEGELGSVLEAAAELVQGEGQAPKPAAAAAAAAAVERRSGPGQQAPAAAEAGVRGPSAAAAPGAGMVNGRGPDVPSYGPGSTHAAAGREETGGGGWVEASPTQQEGQFLVQQPASSPGKFKPVTFKLKL